MIKDSVQRRVVERVLFEEKPSIDTGLLVAIVAMLVIDDFIVTLLLLYFDIPREILYVVVITNILLIGFLYLQVHLRTVMLTDQRIYVRLGLSRSSVLVSDIRSFSVSDPPPWNKVGPGVSRWRGRKVYCFNTSSSFVMIEHGTGKLRKIFFNVEHHPEFIKKLTGIMRNQ